MCIQTKGEGRQELGTLEPRSRALIDTPSNERSGLAYQKENTIDSSCINESIREAESRVDGPSLRSETRSCYPRSSLACVREGHADGMKYGSAATLYA